MSVVDKQQRNKLKGKLFNLRKYNQRSKMSIWNQGIRFRDGVTLILQLRYSYSVAKVQYHQRTAIPKLSPYDVNQILGANEYSHEFTEGSVKSYDSNQSASNQPIEDTRSEASCLHTSGFLAGIFDGHAGPACAQIIAKRLMRYIGAALVPPDFLKQQLDNGIKSYGFLQCHNDKVDFVREIRDIYEDSFHKYARNLCQNAQSQFNMNQALENAFLQLDGDISREALQNKDSRTMAVAMSGAVACVAHIDGQHLHIANTGDCAAVLGTISDTGQWLTKKLTHEHNSDNVAEIRRILSEHPPTERDTVIRGERLLGQLAPLRAFGDFRYKWPVETLEKLVAPIYGNHVIAQYYQTPPYLTCTPEITHHILSPRDRFLVLATDGLWDMMSPIQVVKLVGEHMSGKAFLQPLKLPKKDLNLGSVSQLLMQRKAGLSMKPLDKNAATHLIRNALGGTEYGIEHTKISHLLSLPQDIVRLFRDDITVTVIYFDQEYLRNSPA